MPNRSQYNRRVYIYIIMHFYQTNTLERISPRISNRMPNTMSDAAREKESQKLYQIECTDMSDRMWACIYGRRPEIGLCRNLYMRGPIPEDPCMEYSPTCLCRQIPGTWPMLLIFANVVEARLSMVFDRGQKWQAQGSFGHEDMAMCFNIKWSHRMTGFFKKTSMTINY